MTDDEGTVSRPALGLSAGQAAVLLVVVLTAARFAIAPFLPLAFDEAYYWRWSLHPTRGYLDHPPAIAWLIRAGTDIAGGNGFGIRLGSLLLGVAASWAVWRAAIILFGRRDLALTAVLFFNLTLIVSVGMVLAVPDAPLLAAAAFLLYCLAKVSATGRPVWWLVAGIVTGIGLLSKYTALFWPPSILIWLLLTPRMRPWLATIWPWAGAVVALLIFLPNLIWNATNDWLTFDKQFGRVTTDGLNPEFLLDHLGQQVGLATPIIFVLGWLALGVFLLRRGGPTNGRVLLSAMVWPTTAYFIFHAFHSQVEGNWTAPIFAAFALAAAAVLYTVEWRPRARRVVDFAGRWATPVALVLTALVYVQALTGLFPLGSSDPTATRLGVGVEALAEEIETLRAAEGATAILTGDYGTTAWLTYYGPAEGAPVLQYNEPERWSQELPPGEAALEGPFLAVLKAGQNVGPLEAEYGRAEELTTLTRQRGDLEIDRYEVFRVIP